MDIAESGMFDAEVICRLVERLMTSKTLLHF